jgi:glycosyltransferase involved in cell wall biosynthesis
MLRIAILALSAKAYGGDAYFQAILPALAQYGGQAEFIVLARDDRYLPLCPPGGRVALHRCVVPGSHLGPARVFWEQAVLPRLLTQLGIDVVYTANNLGLLFSPIPCVIAIRNMEPLQPARPGMPIKWRVRHEALRRLTMLSIKRARRVIAVSGFVRDTLVAYGVPVEKIDVIYHGIDDLAQLCSQIPGDSHTQKAYVASAAKFVRYANLTTLFRAFAKMRQLGYQGELRFAGGSHDHTYEQEVRALVRELHIESHVHFLGYIPRRDVQLMIRNSDAFLFSSTLEACPFTLLEALWQGASIVATTAKPMPEFCGDAALYVEPTDSDGFGEAAYRVVSSPELQALLRRKSRERAQRFRWQGSVEQLTSTLGSAACAS